MGHNPSRYKLKALSVDAQHAVDEYKARSVWGAWWELDEKLRRRYFTKDERAFITRYGARLDEIACHRTMPSNEKEQHFLRVCVGEEEPATSNERLWLLVQVICRYQRAVDRAARADLAEHDAVALRAENRALKAQVDHYELRMHALGREIDQLMDPDTRVLRNVVWMTARFKSTEAVGPAPRRFIIGDRGRAAPVGTLTINGVAE